MLFRSASSSLHYGIFFGNECGGVCCVAINGTGTAGPFIANQFGIERKHLTILVRGACVHWAPTGANSKLVSWTARLVAKEGAKIMLAFSDDDAG